VKCRKFIVHGRVQGVFFRASARTEALRLGLGGHARNLADGTVEVLACGEPASVEALAGWLQQGPPLARVSKVDTDEYNGPVPAGFTAG